MVHCAADAVKSQQTLSRRERQFEDGNDFSFLKVRATDQFLKVFKNTDFFLLKCDASQDIKLT